MKRSDETAIINGLNELYIEALERKDYATCRYIKLEIAKVVNR